MEALGQTNHSDTRLSAPFNYPIVSIDNKIMNAETTYGGRDIFPHKLSPSVQKLEYPEKNFIDWNSNAALNVSVLFMNDYHKIYFCEHERNNKNIDGVQQIGRACQEFENFLPKHIDWSRIAHRYKRCLLQKIRKNADIRMCFNLGNLLLVKTFFTFGLRTVKEATVHLIQTL